MGDWTLTSNHQIDNLQVGKYAPYLVMRVRSYVDIHTVTIGDNSTFEKLTFIVDNAEARQEEGREKIIHCIVHESAVRKHAPLIKANAVCICFCGVSITETVIFS